MATSDKSLGLEGGAKVDSGWPAPQPTVDVSTRGRSTELRGRANVDEAGGESRQGIQSFGLVLDNRSMTKPAERRCYKNPPIEEALVEFRMASGQEWDPAIPGKLQDKLKDDYPGKARQQKLLRTTIRAAPGRPPDVSTNESVGRVQLVNEDAHKLISLGAGVLSVNVLRPYEGWDSFRSRIDRALHAYFEISNTEQVSRIGVRYINRIAIPTTTQGLGEYFVWPRSTPPGVPVQLGGFFNRVEHIYDDGGKLLVTFATLEADQPGKLALLLDLDVIWEGAQPLDATNALIKADELRTRERTAFEALITDKTRELFDET